MFTVPIIYKPATEADRQEFIKHLKDVGYENHNKHKTDYLFTENSKILGCGIYPYAQMSINTHYDCGSNLELAKVLSALRDDSDYMQWFLLRDDKSVNTYIHIQRCYKEWYLMPIIYSPINEYYRKATKEELIKKFGS